MKKYLVILGALLMVAGSAFGQTLLNQDSCDIAVSPSSTLLLPYFSVSQTGETTLVTVTNVSDVPAVAHFTVWTNLSYPILDFNVFLTGYDVQAISLTDVLINGTVPSTSVSTTLSPTGARSLSNLTGNPNRGLTGGDWDGRCGVNQGGTGVIPPGLLAQVQAALTGGGYFDCAAGRVSLPTATMVGYITIDVVDNCSQDLPTAAGYFTNQILHDNQIIGDYIRIDAAGGVSGASPLVHIKSIPFGGTAPPTAPVVVNFTKTFYDRYEASANINLPHVRTHNNRRQPLPSQFAARYIEPGTALNFNTNFTIWRQGITNVAGTNCTSTGVVSNQMPYVEFVRFDERENPTTLAGASCVISPCESPSINRLPETSLLSITNTTHIPPDSASTDPGGWIYMNLADSAADVVLNYGATQAWVQVRMTAAGLFGVDFDAAYMANGCSAFKGVTSTTTTGLKIGPHWN